MEDIKAQLLDLSTNAEVALGEWLISLAALLILVTAIKWVYVKRSNTVSNLSLIHI